MLKRTRSFDWLLVAIFAAYALLQIVEVRALGNPLYLVTIPVCLLVVRLIIRADSLEGAVVWVDARPRLAFLLVFVWLTTFLQIGWAFWLGYLSVGDAVGGYIVSVVVFSTVLILGYLLVSFVGRLLASLW